jgi:hypothetical protein
MKFFTGRAPRDAPPKEACPFFGGMGSTGEESGTLTKLATPKIHNILEEAVQSLPCKFTSQALPPTAAYASPGRSQFDSAKPEFSGN